MFKDQADTGYGWGKYICTCSRAYVLMCPLFRISETPGRITLRFGLWLENHQLGDLQKLMAGYTYAYVPMCAPLFRISGMAELCVWLEDHWLCVLYEMGDICTSARVTVRQLEEE